MAPPVQAMVLLVAVASLLTSGCRAEESRSGLIRALAAGWAGKFEGFLEQVDALGGDALDLSKHCKADLFALVNELTNPNITEWSWTMVDSWGLPEAGFLSGNMNWEGRMQQCKEVKSGVKGSNGEEIKGKYCNLGWPIYGTWKIPAGLGICIPSSCTSDDLFDIVQALAFTKVIATLPSFPYLKENVTLRHCAEIPDWKQDGGAIAAVAILCFFVLLGVVGSAYDIARNKPRPASTNAKTTAAQPEAADGPSSGSDPKTGTDHIQLTFKGDVMQGDGHVKETTEKALDLTEPVGENVADDPGMRGASNSGSRGKKDAICGSVLLSFSAIRHMQNVAALEHARGSIRCLNAIRFLSMCWIVLGHTWQLGLYITERLAAENVSFLNTVYTRRFTHQAINNMNLAVESFFLLSAMLTTISFLKKIKKHSGKPPITMFVMYYVHRFWRLTPVYMLILMFYATMFSYLGTGPAYPVPFLDASRCRSAWWKNLIYLNNLIEPGQLCMGWTWYLACDFQFYIIAPVFLSLLYWKPVAGIVVTSLALCGNLVVNFVLYSRRDIEFFTEIYLAPWTRCGPYLLGIFLGYILVKYNFTLKMNKVGVAIGWIASFAVISLTIYSTYFNNSGPPPASITYLSLQRLLFAFGVGWIVLACCTGYGGFINSILSWVGWVPLAKLSYTGYLVHPIFVYYTYYSSAIQVYITDWNMVYYFLGNLMLTVGVCFLITSFLELPFAALEKIIFRNVKT